MTALVLLTRASRFSHVAAADFSRIAASSSKSLRAAAVMRALPSLGMAAVRERRDKERMILDCSLHTKVTWEVRRETQSERMRHPLSEIRLIELKITVYWHGEWQIRRATTTQM